MEGQSAWSASASSIVRSLRFLSSSQRLPGPKRGSNFWNCTSVEPKEEKASVWERSKPVTSATMLMTVQTPMTMPTIVRNARSLCARRAVSANRRFSTMTRRNVSRTCVIRGGYSYRSGSPGACLRAPPDPRWLLISERFYRSQAARFDGGKDAGDDAGQGREDEARHDEAGRHERRERRERVDAKRDEPSEEDAEAAAAERKESGLEKELPEDVPLAGPDREAQADLLRPLDHGHEHDVRDHDRAHDERDAADEHEERERGRRDRLPHDLYRVRVHENDRVGRFRVRVANRPEDRPDLVHGRGHTRHAALRLDEDGELPVCPPDLAERLARNVGHAVLALPQDGSLLGEETDDLERPSADRERVADRVDAREELLPDVGADHGDESTVLVLHLGEEAPGLEVEVADLAHVRRRSLDLDVRKAMVRVLHELARSRLGPDLVGEVREAQDHVEVGFLDGLSLERLEESLVRGDDSPARHRVDVGRQREDLRRDVIVQARNHRHDRDDRHDADDDPEKREERAELVRGDGFPGDAQKLPDQHVVLLVLRISSPRPAPRPSCRPSPGPRS